MNKPFQAAIVSANNFRGWDIVWEMWNFESNLSTKDIISRYTSKPERGLSTLWPSHSILCRTLAANFVLFGPALETSFLMSLSLESTKRIRFPSCKVIKMNKGNSWVFNFSRKFCFFLFLFLVFVVVVVVVVFFFYGNKRRSNIDLNGGCCVIFVRWFWTTWR